jgi:hypothetical protein
VISAERDPPFKEETECPVDVASSSGGVSECVCGVRGRVMEGNSSSPGFAAPWDRGIRDTEENKNKNPNFFLKESDAIKPSIFFYNLLHSSILKKKCKGNTIFG